MTGMIDIDEELLETAYLEIFDYRQEMPRPEPKNSAKTALLGLFGTSDVPQQSNIMKVQFNPNTLSFRAGTQIEDKKRFDINRNENGIVEEADVGKIQSAVSVSMKLIFDRGMYADNSVAHEVEGFIAMVQNPFVRKVAFYWGKQYYMGQMKDVKAEYQLFDRDGVPMRAVVDFEIELF